MMKTRALGWTRLMAAAGLCFGAAALPSAALAQSDSCATAVVIVPGVTNVDTSGFTQDQPSPTCGFNATFTRDGWYTLTAPPAGAAYSLATTPAVGANLMNDPVLSVYDACGGTELACDDDGGPGLHSLINSVVLAPNQVVVIRIAGFNNTAGRCVLTITETAAPMVPPNDECSAATNVGVGTFTENLVLATQNPAGPNPIISCGFGGAAYDPDVWYRFTAPAAAIFRFDTSGSDLLPGGSGDTSLQLFSDDCNSFVELACNDDTDTDLLSQIEIGLAMGDVVLVRVSAFPGDEGAFNLNITNLGAGTPPANDNCLGSPAVATVGTNSGTNLFASQDGSVPLCTGGATINDVWYTFTPAMNGVYEFSTNGSALADTVLAVLDGCNGTELACDDDGGTGLQSLIRVNLTMGAPVFVQVGGFGSATGDFDLNIAFIGALDDSCNLSPTLLTVNTPVSTDNNSSPGTSGIVGCSVAGGDLFDRFFSFTAPANAWYRVEVSNSDPLFDANISIASDCTFTDGAAIDPITGGCIDLFIPGVAEAIAVQLSAGQNIRIRVAGGDNSQGAFDIVVNQPPVPANDECVNAITVSGDTNIDIDALNAVDDIDVSCNDPAAFSARSGVWYNFTTGATGGFYEMNFDVNAVANMAVTAFDNCNDLNEIGCAIPPLQLFLPANSNALVLISSPGDFPPVLGSFQLAVTFTAATGACCNGASCSILNAADCATGGGTYQGDLSNCLPVPEFITEEAPIAVADAAGFPGVTQSITVEVADNETISTLELLLDIQHTFPGDLQVRLTGPDTVTTAQLMTRAGRGGVDCDAFEAPFGSGNDLDGVYVFTDAAATGIHTAIVAGPAPLASGSFRAQNCDNSFVDLNTVFGGQNSQGTWTVSVADFAGGDVGTLFAVALNINSTGAPVCDGPSVGCPGDYNNDGQVDLLDLLSFNGEWSGNLGTMVPMGTLGDYDNSGTVDLLDLLSFNGDWSGNLGTPCP